MHGSRKWFPPSGFPSKSSMHLSSSPYVLRALPTSVLDFITRIIVNQIILDNYEVSEIYLVYVTTLKL